MLQPDHKAAAEAVERGVAAHRDGRFDEAIGSYRMALEARPGDAEIQSLLGLVLVHAGHAADALSFLNQAVTSEPDQMGFRFNLAEGLIATRDLERAEAELNVILASNPGGFQVWDKLGDVAALRQDIAGAGQAWRRAFEIGGRLPSGLKLARLELGQSHLDAAKAVVEQLSTHFPAVLAVLSLRCDYLAARRDWPALQVFAAGWARTQPGNQEPWRALARASFELGRYRDAVQAFQRILAVAPPAVDDLAALAGLQLHALDFDAAAQTLDRAEAIAPDHPGMLGRRALLHMYCGRFDAAVDCSRRSIAGDAENVSAYVTLSRVLHGRMAPDAIEALGRIAERMTAPPDLRIPAAFTIAHAHDVRADTDLAFAAYQYAQAIALERDRLEGNPYEVAASERRFQRLSRLLPAEMPDIAPRTAGPRPVFIVGMPRSGTTLVECVLGAHSRVIACGERLVMRQVLRTALELEAAGRAPDAATLAGWAAVVLAELPDPGVADHFTDKHPLNFEAIGLIARLFPDAAILYLRRNPVESGLSIYRQEFSKAWTFAHRFEDIAHYCGLQARLMAHWRRMLPGRITTVQYETFAADPETEARRLVESFGLGWEPACLEFQHTERAIATFSTIEARGPITVRNDRAQRYRRHLVPLVNGLAAAGVDLVTGALVREGGVKDPVAG